MTQVIKEVVFFSLNNYLLPFNYICRLGNMNLLKRKFVANSIHFIK